MGSEPAGGPVFYGRERTPSTPTAPATPAGLDPASPRPPLPPFPPLSPWNAPPPPAAPTGRRFLAFLVVVALLASVAGGAFFFASRHHGPSYPKQWDARVAPLVSFVERERGLDFDHPVAVKFLSEAEFKKTVTTSADSLTKSDRADIRNTQAFLRALGLIDGDTDLLAEVN